MKELVQGLSAGAGAEAELVREAGLLELGGNRAHTRPLNNDSNARLDGTYDLQDRATCAVKGSPANPSWTASTCKLGSNCGCPHCKRYQRPSAAVRMNCLDRLRVFVVTGSQGPYARRRP